MELLEKEILTLEELEFIEEHGYVAHVDNLGNSSKHVGKIWYAVSLENGKDYDVYVEEGCNAYVDVGCNGCCEECEYCDECQEEVLNECCSSPLPYIEGSVDEIIEVLDFNEELEFSKFTDEVQENWIDDKATQVTLTFSFDKVLTAQEVQAKINQFCNDNSCGHSCLTISDFKRHYQIPKSAAKKWNYFEYLAKYLQRVDSNGSYLEAIEDVKSGESDIDRELECFKIVVETWLAETEEDDKEPSHYMTLRHIVDRINEVMEG